MKSFSLYHYFKDLKGFKLIHDCGNNIEFDVSNPEVFIALIKFLSSIACRPSVSCDNASGYELSYMLHVSWKEEMFFKSKFRKWKKSNSHLFGK